MMGIAALTSLPSRIGIFLIIAFMIGAFGYMKGREAGKVEQLKDSVEAYKNRNEINNEVNNLDDIALCIALGGLPDECNELRGLD
jgi:hypothetical protein